MAQQQISQRRVRRTGTPVRDTYPAVLRRHARRERDVARVLRSIEKNTRG